MSESNDVRRLFKPRLESTKETWFKWFWTNDALDQSSYRNVDVLGRKESLGGSFKIEELILVDGLYSTVLLKPNASVARIEEHLIELFIIDTILNGEHIRIIN